MMHRVAGYEETLQRVAYLVARGASLKTTGSLFLAVASGSLPLVQHLLVLGADVHERDEAGRTCLHHLWASGLDVNILQV